MGTRLKVMILANEDPITALLLRRACEDPRLEIVGVAFSASLTRSRSFARGVFEIFKAAAAGYFAYAVFQNTVFRAREGAVRLVPGLARWWPGFFSLRVWAAQHGIPHFRTPDLNAPEFLAAIDRLSPDLIVTRVNQILRAPLLARAPHGCWCLHSSALPKYRGIGAEFRGLAAGDDTLGFTVMQMETRLDAGPILAQREAPVPAGATLHGAILRNVELGRDTLDEALGALVAGHLDARPQPSAGASYFSWPDREAARQFRRRGLRYISPREIAAWMLR